MLRTRDVRKVRLEYIVHYVKSTGRTSPKVFQIKEVKLAPGTHAVTRKHSFRDLSTRKHYPGSHIIEVVVNGEVKAGVAVELA